MRDTLQDILYGLRVLRQQRWFAIVAIVTLALGTGASTAVFSVIDAAVLHPMPYPHPEQIVSFRVKEGDHQYGGSLDDVRAWAAMGQASPLSHVAIERTVFPERIFDAGTPERVESMMVSEDYFALFGVAPALGRFFTADDTRFKAPVAIV